MTNTPPDDRLLTSDIVDTLDMLDRALRGTRISDRSSKELLKAIEQLQLTVLLAADKTITITIKEEDICSSALEQLLKRDG
jgi:hypothetical protein